MVKRDINGVITRFKAQQIVKSYLQQYGVDFNQIFLAIVKLMAFKILFAITTYYNFYINQMDVKINFFYGFIN